MQMTDTGAMVYRRTYARVKPDGTREVWPETVQRVVDGNLALVDARYQIENERRDLIEMMTEFKILPAGRHLWASGVSNATHLMNCWTSGFTEKPWEHFEFSFLRLMEGGGVGANYSNHYLSHYPPVQQDLWVQIVCDDEHPDYEALKEAGVISDYYDPDWPGAFVIEDSREGWASALTDLIRTHYREEVGHYFRVYDVSRVRHAGAKLRTFGGRASGPLPLAKMLIEVCETLSEIAIDGRQMDGIDAMEIDHAIAQCVVAGGVRRSARMAIIHWNDRQIFDFIRIKQKSGSHWTTNISVEVDADFWHHVSSDQEVADGFRAKKVLRWMTEGMVNNGEPGFWDSSLSNKGEPTPVTCTNPCLTGDTVIATIDGPRTFADLAEAGEDVEVYSWHPETKTPVVRWMRRPHKTREGVALVKVTFDSGLVVRCTPEHSFYTFRGNKVQAKDLMGLRSKSIRAFSASYDSSGHERIHGWDSRRNAANHQWTHRMIWENAYGPIADGMHIAHLDHNSSHNELSNFAVMTPYEHASYDYPLRAAAGFDGTCANHKVVSVKPGGFGDVYNGMVEDSHTYIVLDPEPVAGHMSGIVSANCGEITLESWEPCNLGHVNLAAFVKENGRLDQLGLLKAHQLMTRFLIRATFSPVGDPKSRKVLDRNRRTGVGHLGVASALAMLGKKYSEAPADKWFRDQLRWLASVVDDEAASFSHQLRIPVPVKKRTVAPTGTVAKLVGVSEGIHAIYSRYFMRRIRFSTVDPNQMAMADDYRRQGYSVEEDIYADNTVVISIPTKDTLVAEVESRWGEREAEEIVQSADELTLNEMLAFQAMYQMLWADNAVSYTANVDSGQYTPADVSNQIEKFGGLLKGCTIFPQASMPQAPYERITKAEYEAATVKSVADGVDEDCGSSCPIR